MGVPGLGTGTVLVARHGTGRLLRACGRRAASPEPNGIEQPSAVVRTSRLTSGVSFHGSVVVRVTPGATKKLRPKASELAGELNTTGRQAVVGCWLVHIIKPLCRASAPLLSPEEEARRRACDSGDRRRTRPPRAATCPPLLKRPSSAPDRASCSDPPAPPFCVVESAWHHATSFDRQPFTSAAGPVAPPTGSQANEPVQARRADGGMTSW